MKKLLSFLGSITILSGSVAPIVSCNTPVETINLNKISAVSAPPFVIALNAASVTKTEVKTALSVNVLAAVTGIAPGALETIDYTFDVFKDASGTAYSNVNLATSTADVYIKISATSTSKLVSGSTNYLKVTLPQLRTDISSISAVSAPVTVLALNTDSVTKTEVKAALTLNVLSAVAGVAPGALETIDYTFDIFKDAVGTAYSNVNLSSGTADVYVKISATSTSLLIAGQTTYLKVTLPQLKTNINTITSVSAPASVITLNPANVTKTEVKAALALNVLSAVTGIVPGALETIDYTFDVFKDATGTAYSNVNLSSGTADVYVKISAVSISRLITGETGYLKVTLPQLKASISNITSVSAPASVITLNPTSVTKSEVKAALALNVLSAVAGVAPGALETIDYTFDVFKDASGTAYSNINLVTGTADVYVKITATSSSILATGETGYLKVTLPQLKKSIATITSVNAPTSVLTLNPANVTKTEVKAALDLNVLAAVAGVVPGALETIDYTFDVFKDAAGTAYSNVNLATSTADVYVKISATSSSILATGETGYLKVTLPTLKTNINTITSVSAPLTVLTLNPASVTKAEVKVALGVNVLAAVTGIAPGALETIDYTFDVFKDASGTAYSNVNLATGPVDVYVKISAVSSSRLITGETGYLKVTLPALRTNISTITSVKAPLTVITLNPISVTKAEVKVALGVNVLAAVTGVAPGALEAIDYTFDVFKDAAGTAYSNVNLLTGSADVYVKISATSTSLLIAGQTNYLKVTLPKIL